MIDLNNLNGFLNFVEYRDNTRNSTSELKEIFEKNSSLGNLLSIIEELEDTFKLTKFTFTPNGELDVWFKQNDSKFEFSIKYKIYRSGISMTNLKYI